MEEALINFETAKLAKEKGFNIPVNNFYDKDKPKNWVVDSGCNETEYYFDLDSTLDNYNYKNLSGEYYSRPTQSLLQKWLREIHNIHVEVNAQSLIGFKVVSYIMGDYANAIIHPTIDETTQKLVLTSYEQALELGLIEGLNLIKKL